MTAPSTPERIPRGVNRSVTMPARMPTSIPASVTSPTVEIGAAEGIETLFTHPNAKVIKFVASSRRLSGYTGQNQEEVGTLPWSTSNEQTLASGPLEIYRVPGSVSFIHSGSLLHAILPRSQCWCVDGKSKFAMRVALPHIYYRIELPGDSPEDLENVKTFEETLRKVLVYEKTVCPFARGFSVEIPEQPEVRKKRRKQHGPAKRWRLHRAYSWKPEDGEEPPLVAEDESGSAMDSEDDRGDSYASSDESEPAEEAKSLTYTTPPRPTVRQRVAGLTALGAAVSPPRQQSSHPTTPSRLRTGILADADADNTQSTADSPARDLRTLQNIPTDMPPSPPDSSAGFDPSDSNLSRIELSLRLHDAKPVIPEEDQISRDAPRSSEPQTLPPDEGDESEHTTIITADAEPDSMHTPTILPTAEKNVEGPIDPVLLPARDLRRQGDGEDTPVEETPMIPSTSSLPGSESDTPSVQDTAIPAIAQISPISSPSIPAAAAEPTSSTAPIILTSPQHHPSSTPNLIPCPSSEDPFLQIQARIQARRSIGTTTSSSILRVPSTSSSSSSSSHSSHSSTLSRQSHNSALASALIRNAVSTFLGPPAALVAIMLRIASRFANGVLSIDIGLERTPSHLRRVPGSFDLDDSDIEDGMRYDGYGEGEGSDEDDFGVALSPPPVGSIMEMRRRVTAPSITTAVDGRDGGRECEEVRE